MWQVITRDMKKLGYDCEPASVAIPSLHNPSAGTMVRPVSAEDENEWPGNLFSENDVLTITWKGKKAEIAGTFIYMYMKYSSPRTVKLLQDPPELLNIEQHM